jgi:hypothetical protein
MAMDDVELIDKLRAAVRETPGDAKLLPAFTPEYVADLTDGLCWRVRWAAGKALEGVGDGPQDGSAELFMRVLLQAMDAQIDKRGVQWLLGA